MPGLPLPGQISAAPFVTDPSEPTFSQIWDETMGNLGTPADGFDTLLSQMIGLTDAIAPIADLDPVDLGALADVQTELGIDDAGAFVSQMASARSAVDNALGIYSSVVTPSANPTQPVGGTPQPPASGGPSGGQGCPAKTGETVMADAVLGGSAVRVQVTQEGRGNRPVPQTQVIVECSDGSIFAIQQDAVYQPRAGGGTYLFGWVWYLVATPSAVGTFRAQVRVTYPQPPGGPAVTDLAYVITVKATETVPKIHRV